MQTFHCLDVSSLAHNVGIAIVLGAKFLIVFVVFNEHKYIIPYTPIIYVNPLQDISLLDRKQIRCCTNRTFEPDGTQSSFFWWSAFKMNKCSLVALPDLMSKLY